MAVSYTCDGCGEPVDAPAERGLVRIKHYCEACLPAVDELEAKREEAHRKAAQRYQGELEKLGREARKRVRSLPDE